MKGLIDGLPHLEIIHEGALSSSIHCSPGH